MKKIFALLLLPLLASSAHALEVTALGGLHFGRTNLEAPPVEIKTKAGLTLGALVNFDVAPMIGVETGLLSNGNKTETTIGSSKTETTYRSLEIPVLARFSIIDIVSVGGGLFFERFGDSTTKAGNTEINASWSSNGFKNTTLGLKLNARLGYPVAPLIKAIFDVSYKHGLTDRAESEVNVKDRALAFLVGASFGF